MEDFQAIYARNIDRVYRLCYLRLGNREDAEDAAQNVFIRWYRSALRENTTPFASLEHEKAYFLRAAYNECRNVKASFWQRNRVALDDLPEVVTVLDDEVSVDPGELLRGLPEKYREVLYLYYYEGYSTAEVAELLSRNESTVRTQLQKGRERLRCLLEKEGKL